MDFKFLELVKQIISEGFYAIVVKLVIAFVILKKAIQLLYKTKKTKDEYIDLKTTVADLKTKLENMDKENQKRDLDNFAKITQVNHKIDNVVNSVELILKIMKNEK
ncbi:MAG: hypothetical protein EBT63_06520 [Proteobacteria bacterium]|jgi:hypothetical protein|nr:hypothetical protein [Pseudomonadota bacterium]NCA28886.1 hypothetical protein [Pseudomonadota bacterium]